MTLSISKAGIPGENLLIALEPEAASIYCQYLPTKKLNGADEGFTMAEVGTKYMIVDLGGEYLHMYYYITWQTDTDYTWYFKRVASDFLESRCMFGK